MTPPPPRVGHVSTQASGGTGIFAKLVAQFLVKWIKKTRDAKRGEQPALSATPSPLTGPRPDRDRSRENFGEHTGSQGVRAAGAAASAQTVQGGTYGEHGGGQGVRASEAPPAAQAVQGGTYGQHAGTGGGVATAGPARPNAYTAGQRPSWTELVRQEIRRALQNLAQQVLRELGLSDRQLAQANSGHVPSGQQLSPAGQGQWQMTPTSPESQLATNAHHTQTSGLAAGQTAQLQLPGGGRAEVLILEVSL